MAIGSQADLAEIEHDDTSGDQRFDRQVFDVAAQTVSGAVVVFETQQTFTHTTQPSLRRDVRLRLSQAVASRWRLTRAEDRSDHAAGQLRASVSAESDHPGDARFFLHVDYIEQATSATAAGDYQTTIVATISAK